MKKTIIIAALAMVCSMQANAQSWAGGSSSNGKTNSTEVMTKQADGTYVINTTTLCKDRGYQSPTPLMVYIKGDKVVKVEALKNQETPKYFNKVKSTMLPKYNNIDLGKSKSVDTVTSATMSSKAVKKNVAAAVAYYKKNK